MTLSTIFSLSKLTFLKIQFKEIQAAYDVLFDKDKRDIYDKHGMDGLKGGAGAGGGMDDLFSMFTGMGGARS